MHGSERERERQRLSERGKLLNEKLCAKATVSGEEVCASYAASENELNGHAHTHTREVHTHTLEAHSDCCCCCCGEDALIASKSPSKFMAKVNAAKNSIGQSSTWPKFFDRVTPTFSRVLQTHIHTYLAVYVCVFATFAFTFAMPTIFSFNSAYNF